MKAIFLFLLLATVGLFFSGCATCPEDKAFFEGNWKRPGTIDAHMS